jgi:hypothetical protein
MGTDHDEQLNTIHDSPVQSTRSLVVLVREYVFAKLTPERDA